MFIGRINLKIYHFIQALVQFLIKLSTNGNIANKIAGKLKLDSKDKKNLKLAAKYSKCDLVSDMANEFQAYKTRDYG